MFAESLKVGESLCTQVIPWISNIVNILILGRFYLGMKVLAWWYMNPTDIVKNNIVKSPYPTNIKQL